MTPQEAIEIITNAIQSGIVKVEQEKVVLEISAIDGFLDACCLIRNTYSPDEADYCAAADKP